MGKRLQHEAQRVADSGGPPMPLPANLDDMGPIMARWPLLLKYDEPSGELHWRYVIETAPRPELLHPLEYVASFQAVTGNKARAYVRIDGFKVAAGRLVWLLAHGEWPKGRLIFKDGNPLNYRIENLAVREDESERGRERRRPIGVARYYDRWQAYVRWPDGRQKNLGVFRTEQDAVAARAAWDAASDLV